MAFDKYGNKLWTMDESSRYEELQPGPGHNGRTRGQDEPDWWVVAKDKDWPPPEPNSLMSLGAAGESSGAGGNHAKPGAGGHPQPYDEHGRYAGTGARGAPPQSLLGRGPQQGEKVGKHYVLPPEVKAGNVRTALVYRQSGGHLTDMEDRLVGQGYSGAPGYVNKPDGQDKKDLGVIPEGTYIIGDVIVKREDARGMGPNCIKLNPDPATAERIRAMSRDPDTFYIHGDNGRGDQSASQGCIIMEWPERKALRELQGAKIRVLR